VALVYRILVLDFNKRACVVVNLLIKSHRYLVGVNLCQAGKAKKLALTACMRKLLTILNAMLKSGMPWRVAASQPA
jgi:hypothetical protein